MTIEDKYGKLQKAPNVPASSSEFASESLDTIAARIKGIKPYVEKISDVDDYKNITSLYGAMSGVLNTIIRSPYEESKISPFPEIKDLAIGVKSLIESTKDNNYSEKERQKFLERAKVDFNELEKITLELKEKPSRMRKIFFSAMTGSLVLGLIGMFSAGMLSPTGYSVLNINNKPYSPIFLFSLFLFSISIGLLLKSRIRRK